jgi:hypothetical protein
MRDRLPQYSSEAWTREKTRSRLVVAASKRRTFPYYTHCLQFWARAVSWRHRKTFGGTVSDWATRALIALSVLAGILVASFGWQRISAGSALHNRAQPALEATPAPAKSQPPRQPEETASVPPSPPFQTPTTTTSQSGIPSQSAIRSLLARARVVSARPEVPGYDRDCGPRDGCVFDTAWTDATDAPDSRNGCDTRNDVLRKSLSQVVIKPNTQGCVVLRGILDDPYTGSTIHFVRGYNTSNAIEIDHLIPLAAAWDLGAAGWSPGRRAGFANDTRLELIAVSGPANQAKRDSTPASWLPPNRDFRCDYVSRYLKAAVHYDIAVTKADVMVIEAVARTC